MLLLFEITLLGFLKSIPLKCAYSGKLIFVILECNVWHHLFWFAYFIHVVSEKYSQCLLNLLEDSSLAFYPMIAAWCLRSFCLGQVEKDFENDEVQLCLQFLVFCYHPLQIISFVISSQMDYSILLKLSHGLHASYLTV